MKTRLLWYDVSDIFECFLFPCWNAISLYIFFKNKTAFGALGWCYQSLCYQSLSCPFRFGRFIREFLYKAQNIIWIKLRFFIFENIKFVCFLGKFCLQNRIHFGMFWIIQFKEVLHQRVCCFAEFKINK